MRRRRTIGHRRSPNGPDHVRTNLRLWERQSDAYDRRFAEVLGGSDAMAWGFWRVPESSLRLLGPVRGKTVLELGCGAARWSIGLAHQGARVIGLDFSRSQLTKAHDLVRRQRRSVELLRANAEQIPLKDGSVDVVLSDWGAMTFCDPRHTVPEVARVLRPGGRFVFATSSPLRAMVQHRTTDRVSPRLLYAYFDLGRIAYPHEVNFVLSYPDWIDLFARNRLLVRRLHETRPPARGRSRYLRIAEERWARRWPLESIWVVERVPSTRRARRS